MALNAAEGQLRMSGECLQDRQQDTVGMDQAFSEKCHSGVPGGWVQFPQAGRENGRQGMGNH
jgi:hypothetical protein